MMFCDKKSAIGITKNPIYQRKTHHIAIEHHFIRDTIEDSEVKIFCKNEKQVAKSTLKQVSITISCIKERINFAYIKTFGLRKSINYLNYRINRL